ncbi:Clp protease ClpP [Corynebacterium glucuronolyticum]|uniref:ATP-dependent Clp protease proteolytic subunit n=1 Tax=Corynebacterium glucuronolyticum TaxID=39791 RepID=A0A7T4ECX8_9CORY|nr:head maturation protease, ClpP-related [Corynebacterium glucuronolyticum]QQB45352.1 Clp protease ClpP [Corynebacterium glucuronolyticum]WKD64032.1 ATP-dependent Clp protease proteolytic subunit [Corynebacterium glucuronolyticum DSM 44120]SMB81495.1 ATP-dependent protease ClpP, protease subunit [Corynebacterium glucuronolyticum]
MAEILMYGPIGFDFFEPENEITAKAVIDQLDAADGEDVTVRISSGGGDVYEGIAIMNALQDYAGKVTVIVESLAASAASFIAVGGADEVLMRPSAEMMIHRAMTYMDGNADDARKTLEDLERQDKKLANIYAEKAGGTVEDWLTAMSAETWYAADEAVAAGLADGVLESKKQESAREPVAASMRRRFKFANRAAAPPPKIPSGVRGDVNDEPSDGPKGAKMDVLNQLAQELGKKPEEVRNALSGFFNEQIEVATIVTAEYPDEVEVVPTGKVEVDPTEPLNDEAEVTAEVGDGFTCEVGAAGAVTVRATDEVKVGDTTDLAITVGEETITVKVNVVAADKVDKETPSEPAIDPDVAPAGDPLGEMVEVPRAHFDYLNEVARNFGKAQAELDEKNNAARVDEDIAAGRFAAAMRLKALDALRADPQAYQRSWGSLPKNTVPVAELGNSGAEAVEEAAREGRETRENLMATAAARAKKGKNNHV